MLKDRIKSIALKTGADICGIAPQSRFSNAPIGFRPIDIYDKCNSVLVFAKRLPLESINARSCIPYTHANSLIMQEVDQLTFQLSKKLDEKAIKSIIIPTDDPYEYWNNENLYGRAILSLRHAGYLAGLGFLGRNTLLINHKYGNMIQIGALLLEIELEGDRIINDACPDDCDLCISNCPTKALDGITVDQKKCRALSVFRNEKGYILKKCYLCRKICPKMKGY